MSAIIYAAIENTITISGANLTAAALVSLVAGYINTKYVIPNIQYDMVRLNLEDFNA